LIEQFNNNQTDESARESAQLTLLSVPLS